MSPMARARAVSSSSELEDSRNAGDGDDDSADDRGKEEGDALRQMSVGTEERDFRPLSVLEDEDDQDDENDETGDDRRPVPANSRVCLRQSTRGTGLPIHALGRDSCSAFSVIGR